MKSTESEASVYELFIFFFSYENVTVKIILKEYFLL